MNLRDIYYSLVPYEYRYLFYKLRNHKEIKNLRSHVYPSDKGSFSLKPFDENKCIFVHITKTAGTSVAKSLFNYMPYHYTAIEYRVIYGRKDFNNYYKFAFVRNPWDRLYSAYRYLSSGGWNQKDKAWAKINIIQFKDFNDFVQQWVCEENINKHIHFKPQHEFICDKHKIILVDYLAYFETLENDFNYICNIMKSEAKLGKHNVNPGLDYRGVYSDSSRAIVANVYADDIQLFGYDFDGISNRKHLNKKPMNIL